MENDRPRGYKRVREHRFEKAARPYDRSEHGRVHRRQRRKIVLHYIWDARRRQRRYGCDNAKLSEMYENPRGPRSLVPFGRLVFFQDSSKQAQLVESFARAVEEGRFDNAGLSFVLSSEIHPFDSSFYRQRLMSAQTTARQDYVENAVLRIGELVRWCKKGGIKVPDHWSTCRADALASEGSSLKQRKRKPAQTHVETSRNRAIFEEAAKAALDKYLATHTPDDNFDFGQGVLARPDKRNALQFFEHLGVTGGNAFWASTLLQERIRRGIGK